MWAFLDMIWSEKKVKTQFLLIFKAYLGLAKSPGNLILFLFLVEIAWFLFLFFFFAWFLLSVLPFLWRWIWSRNKGEVCIKPESLVVHYYVFLLCISPHKKEAESILLINNLNINTELPSPLRYLLLTVNLSAFTTKHFL